MFAVSHPLPQNSSMDLVRKIWIQPQRWGPVHFYENRLVAHEAKINNFPDSQIGSQTRERH